MTQLTPTPTPLTAEETRLAEALLALVDYTGRVLLTALAGTSLHYLSDKARSLAAAAGRVADLTEEASRARDDGGRTGRPEPVRLPAISRAVATRSQVYAAGRVLFPRATRPGADR